MSDKVLHILNGDATLAIFKRTPLKGDCMVWREILSDGPADVNVGQGIFWAKRADFISQEYHIPKDEYFEKTVYEFGRFKPWGQYDEIVLWFEFDLFCQINLAALGYYFFRRLSKLKKIALVCAGDPDGSEQLRGLGELSPNRYMELYQQRTELDFKSLLYLTRVWKLWCSDDHSKFPELLEQAPKEYPFIKAAIQSHFERFPRHSDGFNEIEHKILDSLRSKAFTEKELIRSLLKNQGYLGLGDGQYRNYIDKISHLIDRIDGKLYLNEKGKEVLMGKMSFDYFRQDIYFYGGSEHLAFVYNNELNTLKKLQD